MRSHEVLDVALSQIVETDAREIPTVPSGKGEKYRETLIPDRLAKQVRTIEDIRDASSDNPIISVTTTQSLRNWTQTPREQLAEQQENARWQHVSFHDLRSG